MNFEVIGQAVENAKIKVVGVGGAGGNAVIHMINHNIEGVDFICANTDTQALSMADGAITLKLGNGLTKGLGAGANPDVGRKAAESDRAAIEELLVGADMIFITAGMGGGTGTGAAPVVASIAKDLGALTVAVVTKPFKFEGKKRMTAAEKGLAALVEEVDSLVTIPNQKLYEILGEDTAMQDAFAKADDVLKGAVQGISDII
jgi:cell division protein FtsZ